jgi:hypothetical protein
MILFLKRAMSLSPSSLPSMAPAGGRHAAAGSGSAARVFRLVDRGGNPHPVLDDHYDSLEAALGDATLWWQDHAPAGESMAIGVEVSTSAGCWRTLRHPDS